MKALALSGGAGTRLRPLTHTSAERLVPVADEAVLFHGPESPAGAGITHALRHRVDGEADAAAVTVGRVGSSLLGRHVEVTPAPSVPSAHRFVLADHSKVQIHI
ncbi:hypothetical protein GCM10023220_12550 [Streptomyces ziwulingensis]|uniref:Nucleotidyl transferase domain-containing protein n=1 Tax=Streptomyces ziwulingensis TaxID=1045501 RepID=A0ABP9B537_9ACTN